MNLSNNLYRKQCTLRIIHAKFTVLKLFAFFILNIGISACEKDRFERSITDYDVMMSHVISSGWRTYTNVSDLSENELRQVLISELATRTGESTNYLQSIKNDELADASLLCSFFTNSGLLSANELSTMSIKQLKNQLIELNNSELSNYSESQLSDLPTKKLVQLAYSWYLPKKYASLINSNDGLIAKINPDELTHLFGLKDNLGHNMDVLRIVQTNATGTEEFKYLGVSHYLTSNDNFNLNLAGSNDLLNWTFITEIDYDAHQGDIVKWGDGYLIAHEEDKIQGYNNIALKFYDSYNDLISNNYSFSKSIETTLHKIGVEGTPDIRNFTGTSPLSGTIQIGFHYYDGHVDHRAMGILKNGYSWTAWKDVISEYNLREMNFEGNIGSRKSFIFEDTKLTLQEAQINNNDWSSWRTLLGLNDFYTEVYFSTPGGSTSFANPGITVIENGHFAITLFIPGEGSAAGEGGETIFIK